MAITFPSAYVKALDTVFKNASVTSNLDAKPGSYIPSNVDEATVYIQSLTLQGLATYSRSTGYVAGTVTTAWNSHTFSQERGRKFTVDTMDLREAYLQIGRIGAEFERVHVAPEIDAYRFEAMITACGIDAHANLTYDTVIDAIDTGIQTLDDAEVPADMRTLYVSNAVYKKMKDSGVFTYIRTVEGTGGGQVTRSIETYEGMPVKKVPAARFYSDFTFAASGAGGFAPTTGSVSYFLNFVIVYEPSIIGIKKHVAPKIVPPAVNTDGDFYVYGYRVYHDLFVPLNKVSGVYAHAVVTAET